MPSPPPPRSARRAPEPGDATRLELHNVGGWVTRWAARRPTRLVWADDEQRFSYAEAEDRIARLVDWLLEVGIQPGDRVAYWLANRAPTLEVLFATARVGAIALPINARLTPAEVAFQLGDATPRVLFVEPEWRERADSAVASMAPNDPAPRIAEAGAHYEALLETRSPSSFCAPVSPEDPMILMYTSGTTGHPKGALLPHRKALYNSLNAQLFFDVRASDHVLVVAPLFHSLGLQILALPAVYAGAGVRLMEGFDAERVWETVEREGVRYFGGVPTMHQRLLDALVARGPEASAPESLRFVFTAGAAASPELIRGFHERGVLMKQGYGQTETSILTCLEPEQALRKAGSVGRPVFHAELRLVDPETLDGPTGQWRDVTVGQVGEVVVRGPITMLGYWERPEATAETLRDGWVRTGDLATRDEDFDVTLVGRAREMFISGGENVYPAEIEAALMEHPAVAEAAVVADPDPEWGEVGRAHVVAAPGEQLDPGVIADWLGERLARFKQPRRIFLEQALPRTASGKVQKHRLRSHGDATG